MNECKNCKFGKFPQRGRLFDEASGYCRRYAPRPDFVTRIPDDEGYIPRTGWPIISEDDWCGEFEQLETK